MQNAHKVSRIESEMRTTIAEGKAFAAKGDTDQAQESLAKLEGLKAERDSLIEASRDADRIRGKVATAASASGWKTVAEAFVEARKDGHRDLVLDIPLKELHKAATVSDLLDEAVLRESGIRPLLEDTRSFASMLPQKDPGNALSVEHFAVTSRSLASGPVERDPLSMSAKAVADVTVEGDQLDLRQFAVLSGNIPNAAFRSVPALQQVVQTALGRELDQALDSHARAALDASTPAAVSGGSGIFGELRTAKQDLIDLGVEGPFLAVIGSADAVALDLNTADDMPIGFPWGLNIASMTNLAAGQGYVMAQSAMSLYKGAARLDADPFSAFAENATQLRLEFEALAVVDEPSAIISLGGVSFAT